MREAIETEGPAATTITTGATQMTSDETARPRTLGELMARARAGAAEQALAGGHVYGGGSGGRLDPEEVRRVLAEEQAEDPPPTPATYDVNDYRIA